MSNYQGYQGQQQRSFAPPPGGAPAGGYGNQRFAPPPPPPNAPAGGAFPGHSKPGGMPPGPPPAFQNKPSFAAPPPPPHNSGVSGMQNSMGNMSIGQQRPGTTNPAPGGFNPGAPPGNMYAPPPSRQNGPPSVPHPGPPAPQQPIGGFKPGPPAPQQPMAGFNPGPLAPQQSMSGFNPPPPGPPATQQQQPVAGFNPTNMMQQPPQMGQIQQPPANSPFHQQAPAPGPPNMMPGQMNQPGPGNMAPAPVQGGQPQQQLQGFQENVDFNIQIPKRLFRPCTKYIPQTASMASSIKAPIGALLRPLAPIGPGEEEVDVVNPGSAGIIRCKKCRLYINAFVSWLENGRRWRCNICGSINECPSAYFCHLDGDNQRRDRLMRPELSKGVVEFVAPSEYMVRPPQPPSYFFVIDVSMTAVQSGMLGSVANGIRKSLDDLPGESRTQVGFITYDNSVQYFSLKAGLSNPQMMVVADLNELFVPAPDDLLVNLKDSRDVVESFLDNLPTMFAKNQATEACLGPALKAAFTVTKNIGGKMCVFQSVLPTLGDGALKPRENFRIMGTAEEMKLIKPSTKWYTDTAVEFCRSQISVDMFLFPYQYIDASNLKELVENTAGTLNTYPMFDAATDGPRFESDLNKTLTQNTAFEAVMRIRCTRGMKISNFYGNFYIRGTDLLALPNCSSDSVFGFHITHDEQTVPSNVVTVQSALLYTSSNGQRRIRVLTQALPVSSNSKEIVGSIDVDAACNLLAKQALDIALKTNLDTARSRLQQTCVDIIQRIKQGDRRRSMPGFPQQQQHQEEVENEIPENLKLLPLYTMALIKNVALRGGTDIHPDERVQAMHRLKTMWVVDSRYFIYPRMFSIHNMDAIAGKTSTVDTEGEDDDSAIVAGRNRVVLPQVVNLSIDRLSSGGVYLLDNGVDMFLWVGRSVDPSVLSSLFGMESLEGVDMNQVILRDSGSDHASRLNAIVTALRDYNNTVAKVSIVREGDAAKEQRFFWYLVEDRASFQGGTYNYAEFMQMVNKQGGAGGGPPGPQSNGPPGMPVNYGGNRMGAPPPPGGPPGPPNGGPPGMAPNYGGNHIGVPPPAVGPPGPPMIGNRMGGPPPPGGPPVGPGQPIPPQGQIRGGPMQPPSPTRMGAPPHMSHRPSQMAPPATNGPPQQFSNMGPPRSSVPNSGPPPSLSMNNNHPGVVSSRPGPPPTSTMHAKPGFGSSSMQAPTRQMAPPPPPPPAGMRGAPPPPPPGRMNGGMAPPPNQQTQYRQNNQY